MATGVDKDICLKILDRGLRPIYTDQMNFLKSYLRNRVVFRGLAKLYDQFDNPEFQEFMARHEIDAETRIAVAEMKNPGDFAVTKV